MALQGAGAVIVAIHVNEAVALGHLGGGGGHAVEAAPGGEAQHLDAVGDGLGDLESEVVTSINQGI